MAKRLRHDDPRQGREHFDLKAGNEWEYGPDPNETTGSIPDVPRSKLKAGDRLKHCKGDWAVTEFGLELLLRPLTRAERHRAWLKERAQHWTELSSGNKKPPAGDDTFKIRADELLHEFDVEDGGRCYRWPILVALEPWVNVDTFADFEDCYYVAILLHGHVPARESLEATFFDARAVVQDRAEGKPQTRIEIVPFREASDS